MMNSYVTDGEVAVIFIRRKDGSITTTTIDASDLSFAESIDGYWRLNRGRTEYFYVAHTPRGTREVVLLHRLIAGAPGGYVVDHINHDTLDNRKSNLRVVTVSQNLRNRRGANRNSSSGQRGVHREGNRWRVGFMVEGREHKFGSFDRIEDAVKVARRAEKLLAS
jgi:hypothetical protein